MSLNPRDVMGKWKMGDIQEIGNSTDQTGGDSVIQVARLRRRGRRRRRIWRIGADGDLSR